ncbi:uncharacterized protein LOC113355369 isoform X2 [Papaver somniferum]|nr:uncharacterized protein LOC113355369 isoform X2 [Papaver somniferum]XP_026453992.1 uncharacterized protein LOC113355369 isoform X2 [Papaver somniferum]XP_026453993.1 uncharacterized protein LOC113355369 isoform X2 [Papaver somniferum]XP_026453994.1 uncharacterized protein LOC113355369 isoform X2 [Papaver somniferum]
MATPTVVIDDHCTVVDREKRRFRCNYCGKEMSRRCRLQNHLAGIREKVLPCDEVPAEVRAQMKNEIVRRKKAVAYTSSNDHCTLVDEKKKRVKCNYCGKEVTTCYRLKNHLAGIRENVLPCDEVPEKVRARMRNEIMRRKKADANTSSNDPCKQNGSLHESSQPSSKKRKHCTTIESGLKEKDENTQSLIDPKQLNARDAGKIAKVAEDSSSRQIQRCIGRFFFENGIDFSAANSPYFQKMIRALIGCGSVVYKVPSCDDLKGWILQEELKASQEHVREIVDSWGTTGCSILLDGWTDGKGRDLINFVVDSPKGPIFMKSADVSDIVGDVDAMIALLIGVIEEVGVQNVVQIVSYTTLGSVDVAGKKLTEKYRTISWTVCASHCIGLILDKIAMLDPWRGVLGKAKDIIKFICSHEIVLKLTRKHTFGLDIVSSRRIGSLTPFLMLERIESQKMNLKNMFSSLEWKKSTLASTADGMQVVDLVSGESSFWTEAQMLLKGSIPLIRALHLISGGDSKPQMGYIYETMKQVKEQIKEEFKDNETKYQPFWTVIDAIWNNQLHKPIHSAAYILNPSLFYCVDFNDDAEIKDGLSHCIEQMVEDKRARYLTLLQLDDYMQTSGTFGDGNAIDQRMTISPEKWWSLYGVQCPELQNFAIRILSQTCTGALRYGLKRSLSEQLHMNGRNRVEQKRLNDLTFVHHNLRLQNAVSISKTDYRDIFLEETDHPVYEWVGGGDVKESVAE